MFELQQLESHCSETFVYSTKKLPDVVPSTGTIAPTTGPPAADKTEAVKMVSAYVPRPIGRPSNYSLALASNASPLTASKPTNAPLAAVNPVPLSQKTVTPAIPLNNAGPLAAVATTDNYIADLNPPHSCQVCNGLFAF